MTKKEAKKLAKKITEETPRYSFTGIHNFRGDYILDGIDLHTQQKFCIESQDSWTERKKDSPFMDQREAGKLAKRIHKENSFCHVVKASQYGSQCVLTVRDTHMKYTFNVYSPMSWEIYNNPPFVD